jgi:hypothetical protein
MSDYSIDTLQKADFLVLQKADFLVLPMILA